MPPSISQLLRHPLTWITLIALGLRVYWETAYFSVIDAEGAEYARLAENLLGGRGYVGAREFAGPQVMFPPLYPLSIAGVAKLLHNVEWSGRIVSILFGTLLVPIMYGTARLLYGDRSAVLCALLAATHPLFIALSGTLYTEGPYFTLLMLGLFFLFRALHQGEFNPRYLTLAGVVLGLGYLTRAEGFYVPFVIAATWLGLGTIGMLRPTLSTKAAGLFLGSFLLVASPYIVWLTGQVGTLRVEGKSPFNLLIGNRMLGGQSYVEAGYAIDRQLNELGVGYGMDKDDIPKVRQEVQLPSYLYAMVKAMLLERMRAILLGRELGAPIVVGLALAGLLLAPWTAARWSRDLLLFGVFGTLFFMTIVTPIQYERYSFSALLPVLLWSSIGLHRLLEVGTMFIARHVTIPAYLLPLGQGAAVVMLVALIARWSYGPVEELRTFAESGPAHDIEKDAGAWIKRSGLPTRSIYAPTIKVPYYAGGAWDILPACDGDLAVRYLEHKRPDLLVLQSNFVNRSYTKDWLLNGVPSPHFRKLSEHENQQHDKVVIYGWTDPPTADKEALVQTQLNP